MMEDRVNNIEIALAKLTIIQEEQTKQTDKLIDSVTDLNSMMILVEQNTKDINRLGTKVADITTDIYKKEALLRSDLVETRKELDKIGQGRLFYGISIAVTVTTFLFAYLYVDLKKVIETESKTLVHQTKVRDFMENTRKKINLIDRHLGKYRKEVKDRYGVVK